MLSWYLSAVRSALRMSFLLLLLAFPAAAFSLLGPYADWMQRTNFFRQPGDIGGPMDLGEEYRWNVPVLTYAFDPSFLDYFGSNGVTAIEQAIQILNDVPPASCLELTNYPSDSRNRFSGATDLNLYDLKSAALSLLLEQLGLATPTRYVFALRRCSPVLIAFQDEAYWPDWVTTIFVTRRNFDPITGLPSNWVGDTLYAGFIAISFADDRCLDGDVWESVVDPFAYYHPSVADWNMGPSLFYSSLTRDDVGGLRYLLSTSNINYEVLLPGIRGAGTNAAAWVNGALRSGVDKLTFVPQPAGPAPGCFAALTNQFTDSYFSNGVMLLQQLERVIAEPDILFCAGNAGGMELIPMSEGWPEAFARTGTDNWWNGAGFNDNASGDGPGVIRPPVRIVFHKLGITVSSSDNWVGSRHDSWAWLVGSTNAPVVFPCGDPYGNTPFTVSLRLRTPVWESRLDWLVLQVPMPLGARATLQTSTNLFDWTSLIVVTNDGRIVTWQHYVSSDKAFFRVMPE